MELYIILIEIFLIVYIIYLMQGSTIRKCFKENFIFKPECDNEPKLKELHNILKPMFEDNVQYDGVLKNINKKKILYDLSLCNGEKSYTINKEDIFLCLKDENDKYYHDNMLIYVLLHEVAHSICPEIGHTNLFKEIFNALLDKAIEMKIYDKSIPVIKNYCLYKK